MKKLLMAGIMSMTMCSSAYALSITPESTYLYKTGTETSQNEINKVLDGLGITYEIYKQNVGNAGDAGSFAAYYETEFFNAANDPEEATITWIGSFDNFIDGAYLLVKGGNQTPAWYLFDLTLDPAWDGMETLYLTKFWPQQGAISHVTFYGNDRNDGNAGGNELPEPATMLLFGTGLIGLAGVARRRGKRGQTSIR